MILVFDTETTGLPDFGSQATLDMQPDVVEIGLVELDEELNMVNCWSALIKDGVPSSPEAFRAHGITEKMRKEYGLPRDVALHVFNSILSNKAITVAHNFRFDYLLMQSMAFKAGAEIKWPEIAACTMLVSTGVCKIPSKFKAGGYKWPTLSEAYRHFYGEDFKGAHRAISDCFACADILRKLVTTGKIVFPHKGEQDDQIQPPPSAA